MKKISASLLAFIFCFYAKAIAPCEFTKFNNNPKAKSEKLKEKLNAGGFSLSSFAFTENKGQVFGYDGLPHPEVKFSFQQGATQIFLLERGIGYQFTKVLYPEGYQELMRDKYAIKDLEKLKDLQKQIRTETFRMDMILMGANKNAEITTEGKSTDYTNFYNHDVLDVHSFSKITYRNIYPGIDWVIYTKGNTVKYDFVVKPGADPSLIKMQFNHQEDLTLNEDGSFTLKCGMGTITEKTPISFQGEKNIDTEFGLENSAISFILKNYNVNETLIIDPALVWATYYGSTTLDVGYACSSDLAGNIYLAGYTPSNANIASGGHQNTYGGGANDAFLVKFNIGGLRLWGTYYGGTNNDLAVSNVCDGSGNVFMSGYTSSTIGIASGGHQNTYGGGTTDAFLVKFNGNGVRQWATYYGDTGLNIEMGWGCASDGSGNIYLSGFTSSTVNIASAGHQNTYGGGGYDAFLVKFNSSGVRQWGTYYGGTDYDQGMRCACDASANVYLAGNSTSTANITSGGHQSAYGGGITDAFLVKFNTSGVRQWGTYYGGTSEDKGTSCDTDGSGNVYLAGYTTSGTDIASGGHQNTIGGGPYDSFLTKFNNNGVRQWGTYYGSFGNELSYSCATEASGHVYLSGYTSSNSGIASGGVQNTYGGGTYDAFLVKFNSGGVRQWGTYYGGTGQDVGMSCASDAAGNFYLVGHTSSTSNISSVGFQTIYGGGQDDAFLAKFCDMPAQPPAISGNTLLCTNSSQSYSVVIDPTASTYSWSIPPGWTGSSSTNTIALVAGSSGVLSLSASNSCGASPVSTLNISVSPSPTISANSGGICIGATFTILPTGASTYTYSGGSAAVSPTITSSYSVSGTNSAGCISSSSAISTITVYSLPLVTANATSTNVCLSNTVLLYGGGASTYTWSSGVLNATPFSPLVTLTYTVIGTNANTCKNTASIMIKVSALPNLIVTSSRSVICSGESNTLTASGATTYTWSNSQTGASIVVSPTVTTSYTLTGYDGCLNSVTTTQVVNACLGITQSAIGILQFAVYPNPNTGEFTIETPQELNITIFSSLGQIVHQQNLVVGKNLIDLHNQANGIYFIQLNQNGNLSTSKIIKD
jgi:hypothetical protein